MSKIRDSYNKYVEGLEIERLEEDALSFDEYIYMYSLYLEKLGFFSNNEEDINIALNKLELLEKIDFEDVMELGNMIAPREFGFSIKEEVLNSEIEMERFNVISRENPREYIETDIGIVQIDLNEIISERSVLRVKDGYKLILYKIKNNFEEKYKVIAFRNYGMYYVLNEEVAVDTYYEGVDLEFDNGDMNYLKYIKGDGSLQSYMDVISLNNEINNLSVNEEEILYGEKRYLTNKYIPNEPIIYKVNEKVYLEYASIKKDDSEDYSMFVKNVVEFDEGDYSFKKYRKEMGTI